MGIPRQGWEICWDAVDGQIQEIKKQQVPKMPLSDGEVECLRSGLLKFCGEVINGEWDLRNRLYQPGELQFNKEVFTEYMDKHDDKCDEDGNNTELVKSILEKAKESFTAAQICQ